MLEAVAVPGGGQPGQKFTNLLIVFSNSVISFELEPRKFNSSNKSDYQKSVLRCFYIYQTYTN